MTFEESLVGKEIPDEIKKNLTLLRDGVVVPFGARYDPLQLGTITADIAAVFKSYGWQWGGDWVEHKDWQHFERPNAKY